MLWATQSTPYEAQRRLQPCLHREWCTFLHRAILNLLRRHVAYREYEYGSHCLASALQRRSMHSLHTESKCLLTTKMPGRRMNMPATLYVSPSMCDVPRCYVLVSRAGRFFTQQRCVCRVIFTHCSKVFTGRLAKRRQHLTHSPTLRPTRSLQDCFALVAENTRYCLSDAGRVHS